MRGRRCIVCGSGHATCGDPSTVLAVDERIEHVSEREPLARYEVEIGGHHTVLKLRPSTAAVRYPGARPLDKARRAPAPVEPIPAPASAPGHPGRVRPLGGGWFLLTTGERVRGRDAALAAQEALEA